jgi:putative transposase
MRGGMAARAKVRLPTAGIRQKRDFVGSGPPLWKHLEVSEATYHRWRTQFGGLKADDVKRLAELEVEDQKLRRIVADQVLEVQALKEIAKGEF